MTGRPAQEPIGLLATRTAKVVSRAFDDALARAGGSLPTWLVLVSLRRGAPGAQRHLAEAVGVEGPTLTHHLNRMEADGLVTRRRDPANRRAHLVELTDAGEAAFAGLLQTVAAFDARLRAGFTDAELDALRGGLDRLRTNAAAFAASAAAPVAEPEAAR
jgi:MarR family transcriptional regulator for hemolysin